MRLKNYSVCLNEEVVKRAVIIADKYGSKLSPLINKILMEWVIEEEKKWA